MLVVIGGAEFFADDCPNRHGLNPTGRSSRVTRRLLRNCLLAGEENHVDFDLITLKRSNVTGKYEFYPYRKRGSTDNNKGCGIL